jgi:hypothetical protein
LSGSSLVIWWGTEAVWSLANSLRSSRCGIAWNETMRRVDLADLATKAVGIRQVIWNDFPRRPNCFSRAQ